MDAPIPASTALCPLIAISPHYDDAVFSCGRLLASVRSPAVITVYTGQPTSSDILTDWDGRCGFTSASEAMRVRATENENALALLRAEGVNLDFLDSQYPQPTRNGEGLLIDTLASTLAGLQPATVVFPLGLFHSDHVLVSDALITLCPRFDAITWLAYEDIPYRKQSKYVEDRLAHIAQRDIQTTPFDVESIITDGEAMAHHKERAVNAYTSQFQGLGYTDAQPIMNQPERYWRLHSNVELL